MINRLSVDSERLVCRESLSWSIDSVVLFDELGSLNIHKCFINTWILETESELS